MKFTLNITMGNDAMQTEEDVAEALRKVADRLENAGPVEPTSGDGGGIMDTNGNKVGTYSFSEGEEEETTDDPTYKWLSSLENRK